MCRTTYTHWSQYQDSLDMIDRERSRCLYSYMENAPFKIVETYQYDKGMSILMCRKKIGGKRKRGYNDWGNYFNGRDNIICIALGLSRCQL